MESVRQIWAGGNIQFLSPHLSLCNAWTPRGPTLLSLALAQRGFITWAVDQKSMKFAVKAKRAWVLGFCWKRFSDQFYFEKNRPNNAPSSCFQFISRWTKWFKDQAWFILYLVCFQLFIIFFFHCSHQTASRTFLTGANCWSLPIQNWCAFALCSWMDRCILFWQGRCCFHSASPLTGCYIQLEWKSWRIKAF